MQKHKLELLEDLRNEINVSDSLLEQINLFELAYKKYLYEVLEAQKMAQLNILKKEEMDNICDEEFLFNI